MSTEEEARQSIRALRDSIHELIRMCSVTGDDDAKVVREKGDMKAGIQYLMSYLQAFN